MIDHTGLSVNDFATSRAFFVKALAPLGYKVMMDGVAIGDVTVTALSVTVLPPEK